jgi:hypothetical protein
VDLPFWMYLIVAGIILSAYMVIRTGKEEKRIEDEIIAREGEIYMQRLQKEREEKKEVEKSFGIE